MTRVGIAASTLVLKAIIPIPRSMIAVGCRRLASSYVPTLPVSVAATPPRLDKPAVRPAL